MTVISFAWKLVDSRPVLFAIALAVVALASSGCSTTDQYGDFKGIYDATNRPPNAESLLLREGDTLRITFPGAPNLNANPQIRRDGKINLSLVGEVLAAGITPAELEKQLVKLYADQLLNKEVNVSVESSSFPVFVTGAVLRPGRVNSQRPITALEAIMEAGGFDYTKANLKGVRVIRHNKDKVEHFDLNLKRVMNGDASDTFYLKPSDIIYVPQKFNWF